MYRKRCFSELPLTLTDQERLENVAMFEADASSRPNCTTAAKDPRSQSETNA